jgi:hypothetical protein
MCLLLAANYLVFAGSILYFLCLDCSLSDQRSNETHVIGNPITPSETPDTHSLSISQGTPLDHGHIDEGRPVITQTMRPALELAVVIGRNQDSQTSLPGAVNTDTN